MEYTANPTRLASRPTAQSGYWWGCGSTAGVIAGSGRSSHNKTKRAETQVEAGRKPALEVQNKRLADLKAQHESQLELVLERSEQSEGVKARRRDEQQNHIDRIFRDYQDWLDNAQTTEDDPYLQVIAVFTGLEPGEDD